MANENSYQFSVDGKQYQSTQQFITGAQIREIAHIDFSLRNFLEKHREENEASGHRTPDRVIHNSYSVDLANPGDEKFYTLRVPIMDIS